MSRPFPFDPQTDAHYESPYWRDRTGVGQLAQVLFRKAEDKFLVLAFYRDGSGEHGKGPFVVAGYLANTIDWFDIERDWVAELERRPSIRYFKARECILRRRDGRLEYDGEFNGWSESEVKRKRAALANVIGKYCNRIVAVGSTLPWNIYDAVIGHQVMKRVFYTPYLLCVNVTILGAVKRSTLQFEGHPGRIAFVFDTESDQLDEDTKQHYRLMPPIISANLADRCGSFTFDTDLKFPLLQLADFLAWSIRAHSSGNDSPCLTTIFTNPMIGGHHEFKWNADTLARLVATTEEDFRKHFPEGIV